MLNVYAYHLRPKGFAPDLDLPGDLPGGDLPNYTALQQGFWDVLAWYEAKCGLSFARGGLVLLESNHRLADWLNLETGGLGAVVKDDLQQSRVYDAVNLFLVFCQRMGGFAGAYVQDRIACVGDVAVDAITSRYQAPLFAGTPSQTLATRDNQLGTLAHEALGHLLLGPEHTDGGDGKNIMGQGIWTFPDASLTQGQVDLIRETVTR